MSEPKLISEVLQIVTADFIRAWRQSRGVIVTELEADDLPGLRSGMTAEELAAYFCAPPKKGPRGRRRDNGRAT